MISTFHCGKLKHATVFCLSLISILKGGVEFPQIALTKLISVHLRIFRGIQISQSGV